MYRKLLKWRISSAIDSGAALAPWLRRRVDADPELAMFESAMRELCARLRGDGPAWLKQHASLASSPTPQRELAVGQAVRVDAAAPRSRIDARAAVAACALAASVLIAIAMWQSTGTRRYQQISDADRERLVAALQLGRANLAQFAYAIKRVDAEVAWPQLASPPALEPGKRARASAERLLTALDHGVEARQQELSASAKSAYAFFTVRLPSSLGALVGLGDG